jgi:hypothetical protein
MWLKSSNPTNVSGEILRWNIIFALVDGASEPWRGVPVLTSQIASAQLDIRRKTFIAVSIQYLSTP